MEIEIPFLYRAVVLRPRRRAEETVTLIGRERVEIPEMGGQDAPIVARFRPRDGERVGKTWRSTDYRLVPGGLAKPYVPATPPGQVTVATSQALFEAWTRNCLSVGRPGGRAAHQTLVQDWLSPTPIYFDAPVSDERGFEVRRWTSNGRASALDRITRAVAPGGGLVFVDGVLHVPSLGPCWTVRDDYRRAGDQYENYVSLNAAPELADVRDSDMVRTYAAARHAEAAAAAASRAQAKGWPLREPGNGTLSARAGSFHQRDDDMALLAVARNMASSMEQIVGKLPTGAIRDYADLKDTIRVASMPGAALPETLLPLVRVVDASWSRHVGGGRVGGTANDLLAYDLRGGRDPEAADLPEIGIDDLRDMGLAPPAPGGR